MAEDGSEQELPLESVGTRLRNARKAAGLSLADVSARTKIAERHLISIEGDQFGNLAGLTYAVGFSRTYARAVDLDELSIAEGVRAQLARDEDTWAPLQAETFEPGDPARVPPAKLAWLATLAAIAVIVIVFVFWRSFLSPAATMGDMEGDQAPPPVAKAKQDQPGAGTAPTGGAVVFTSTEPDIWVKFYDETGSQLFQKQMAQGESYTVPADAKGPQLWTGRADAFRITIGGKQIARLAEGPETVKDLPVSADALRARVSSQSATTASAPAAQ